MKNLESTKWCQDWGQLYKNLLLTSGFVQLGLDVEAMISSAYPGFGFGERNSAGSSKI
jgi:hypothetical protein